ncbi:MAG: VOC family protein [Terriglobia bacterium]
MSVREVGRVIQPQGISEIILVVKDVRRAAKFYHQVVGLAVDQPANDTWAWLWAGPPGAPQRIGLTRGPLSFGAAHCKGPIHFALRIAPGELERALEHLHARGIEVEGPVAFPAWKARSIYFDDLDGNRVELCALPEEQR